MATPASFNGSTGVRPAFLGSLLIVLAAAGFSSKSIWIKFAYAAPEAIEPITLMTLRMLFALPFFVAVAIWRPGPVPESLRARDGLSILWLGLLGYYLASWLDFSGLQYLSASLERLILFLYPTFVVLLTALLYRRAIPRVQAAALLVSYVGMLLLFAMTDTGGPTAAELTGALLVLASAMSFALYMTGAGHVMKRFGSRRFTAWTMSVACLATVGHFLLTQSPQQLLVSPRVVLLGLVLALVSTVAPAFLMNAGIQRLGAARASIISAVGPVLTLLMAWIWLGETMGPLQLLGGALVIGGVLAVSGSRVNS